MLFLIKKKRGKKKKKADSEDCLYCNAQPTYHKIKPADFKKNPDCFRLSKKESVKTVYVTAVY